MGFHVENRIQRPKQDYVRPRSKCHGLIQLETGKSNSMFAARKQNFIGRLDFGGGKGCPWVFFPDFFSFMGDRRLAPLGFGDCVFRGYFSLPGYFLPFLFSSLFCGTHGHFPLLAFP